jgi:hypothetical protein
MHTTVFHVGNTEYRAHHNGDYSGNVEFVRINRDSERSFFIPMAFLVQLVANMKRDQEIARLEQAGVDEILGLK